MNARRKAWHGVGMVAWAALIWGIGLGPGASAAVVFDFREDVNLVNADTVVVTATADAATAPCLVDSMDDNRYWNGGTSAGTAITVDLGEARNLKTIRMNNEKGDQYRISAATVETSPDGAIWTPVPGMLTNPTSTSWSNHETVITLNDPVGTRWVRLTRTDTQGNEWRLNTVRMFGDSGATLEAGAHLDLIASSAYVTPVTANRSGYTGEDFIGPILDDNPASLVDQKYYNWHGKIPNTSNQTWFQFDMKQGVEFGGLGIAVDKAFAPATMHFEVHCSDAANNSLPRSDDLAGVPDFSTSTLLLDYNGPITEGPNFFDLTGLTLATGRYLRVDLLDVAGSGGQPMNTRFGTVMVYQYVEPAGPPIPEPASAALVGLGLLTLWRRRRTA